MSTTVGHGLIGISCAYACAGCLERGAIRPGLYLLAGAALSANLADLDFVLSYLASGDPNRYHQTYSHGLFFALIGGLGLALCLRRLIEFQSTWWIFVLAALSHPLIDLFTGPLPGFNVSYGVPLFTPFYEGRIWMPVTLFAGPRHATMEQLFSLYNLGVIAVEVLVLTPPCLLAAMFYRRAR